MIASLKRVLHRGTPATEIWECRDCGTSVEGAAGGCPICDSGEIAFYRI
jgi:rubrerythrin